MTFLDRKLTITRNNPAAIMILVDLSLSMKNMICHNSVMITMAEYIALKINELIEDLIIHCKRDDALRNYYEIAVIGYCGDGVKSLLTDSLEDVFVSIVELNSRETTSIVERKLCRNHLGEEFYQDIEHRCWVKPYFGGLTPMCEALSVSYDVFKAYFAKNKEVSRAISMLINFSDGGGNDSDMSDVVTMCKKMQTLGNQNDEHFVVMNVHMSNDLEQSASQKIIFPRSDLDLSQFDHNFRSMFEAASEMPSIFNEVICAEFGHEQLPENVHFKAVAYNVAPNQIFSLFNIGSISVRRS